MAVSPVVPNIDKSKAEDFLSKYSEVVQKTWSDPAFKAQFLADPTTVLRGAGVDIPDHMQIKVVEHQPGEKESDTVITIPLPAKPATHIDDEQLLAQVQGGSSCSSSGGSAGSASCPSCSASSAGCAGSAC